ncbi:MAG: hypothetical protein ACRDBG_25780 [Waterburya sp.]
MNKAPMSNNLKAGQARLAQVLTENAELKQLNTSLLQLSNYFADRALAIDNRILETTFKGNFKRKLFFVIANWREIMSLLEYIMSVISEVKAKIKQIQDVK